MLVELALGRDLDGKTELTFDPAGVVCWISSQVPGAADWVASR